MTSGGAASYIVIPSSASGSDVMDVITREGARYIVRLYDSGSVDETRSRVGVGTLGGTWDTQSRRPIYLERGALPTRISVDAKEGRAQLRRAGDLSANEVCFPGVEVALVRRKVGRGLAHCGL